MPWCQPWITLVTPSWNGNGWPRSHEASNCSPFDHDTPTYCIVELVAGLGLRALALDDVLDHQLGRRLAGRCGDLGLGLGVLADARGDRVDAAAALGGLGRRRRGGLLGRLGAAAGGRSGSSSPQATTPAPSIRARIRLISFARIRRSCGAGTRTPTTRARIWRAANYTTPQWAAPSIGGSIGSDFLPFGRSRATLRRVRRREAAQGTTDARGRERINTASRGRPGACAGPRPAQESARHPRGCRCARWTSSAARGALAGCSTAAASRSACWCSTGCWCARPRSATTRRPSCSAPVTCCGPGRTATPRSCSRAASAGTR